MTTDIDVIDQAPATAAALPTDLQDLARDYVAARQKSGTAILEMADAISQARALASHGEWGLWLAATNTTEDTAKRLLDIQRTAAIDAAFRDAVAQNFLGQTGAALLAAPSTPPEVRAAVLAAPTPPSTRQVEAAIKAAKPAPPAKPAPAADPAAPRSLPPTLTPPAAASSASEVIADLPAAPAPVAALPPLLVPIAPTASAGTTQLRQAVALLALLEQAVNVATIDLDQLQRELPDAPAYVVPDAAVEQAARIFLASPAVKGAAGFLAMSAQPRAEDER